MAFGENSNYCLGCENNKNQNIPIPIKFDQKIDIISCGSFHYLFSTCKKKNYFFIFLNFIFNFFLNFIFNFVLKFIFKFCFKNSFFINIYFNVYYLFCLFMFCFKIS